jgi:uncharacterized protein YrrD
MRKGSDIIGKPIVAYDSGDRFSRVKDLIFDQDSNQLLALLISEEGWFSDTLIIPFQSIQAIGSDAVIVPSEDAVIRAKQLPEAKQILGRNNILKGTHIMTTDGRDLGSMVDLYFDEQTGVIEGYEVSGGLFADAYSGRSFVPAPHTLKIGEHVAFVPSEIADLMEEQVGGIKAVVLTASEKVQTAAQTASEQIQVTAQEAGYRLQEAQRSAALSLANAAVDPAEQKAFALGKTAQIDVLAPDGSVLVLAGQSITFLDLERAEELAILDRLYTAAGGNLRQRANERFQGVAQDTGSRLQLAAQGASDRIQSATELAHQQLQASQRSVAATGGRVRDQLALRAESAAAGYGIEEARGYRVQQTVRARNGFIVAAPGQIVTDTVIERAKLYRAEREVLNAVGLSTSAALHDRANSTAASMGNRLSSTTSFTSSQLAQSSAQVKLGARNLWTQMTQAATALQERSSRTLEEQRIKGALGRPVTRVILDQSDEVILNVGELVTHQALDAARSAGVLDVLLGSVYTQSPQFSKAEMSAPEPGKASLTAL